MKTKVYLPALPDTDVCSSVKGGFFMDGRKPKGIYYIVLLIAIGVLGCQASHAPLPSLPVGYAQHR